MTEQERQDGANVLLRELAEQCGYKLRAVLQPRQYGDMIQVEAVIQLEPIPDWQPPKEPTSAPENANGAPA